MLSLFMVSCEPIKKEPAKEEKEEIESAWKVGNVTDEFGDVIKDKSVIMADFPGKMSNSAIENAELIVKMQIQDSTLFTVFYEYGKSPQARLPKGKISIKLKMFNGDVLNVKQYLYENMMVDDNNALMKIILAQDKPFKAIVNLKDVDNFYNGVYSYEISPAGLKGLIK